MNIAKAIFFGIFIHLSIYLGLPTWQFDNPNMWLLFIFWSLCLALIGTNWNRQKSTLATGLGLGFSAFFLIVLIVQFVVGWRWPNDEKYRDLIGKVEIKVYSNEVPPIDQSKIFVIPESTARLLGEKALVDPNDTTENVVGSLVEIGDYTLQEVNNGIYYVAPTLHRSYWKWRENKQGTPGYIMVNAINEKDIQYVDNYKIVYQPGAFFNQNLSRHLWLNGYSTTYLTDYQFEVNEAGRPYWVVTVFDRTIGMFGKDATGCLVVDAETGEIQQYTIETTPDWVDRIQPMDFIETQLKDWGSLAMGYINWQDLNRKAITDGISIVYGNDNDCYYYTGVTSVGKDDATIGFIEVNTKTKKTIFYKQAGATELAAMQSANDLYSDLGYQATFPKTYNVNGESTYIMGMQASSGMIKAVCMVNIENYNTVGTGETIGQALHDYRAKMSRNLNDVVLTDNSENNVGIYIVTRINQDAKSGMFYTLLDSLEKMSIVDGNVFREIYLTQVGDSVIVGTLPSENESETVVYFDNINLDIMISEEQQKLEYDLKHPVNYQSEKESAISIKSEKDSRKKTVVPEK